MSLPICAPILVIIVNFMTGWTPKGSIYTVPFRNVTLWADRETGQMRHRFPYIEMRQGLSEDVHLRIQASVRSD